MIRVCISASVGASFVLAAHIVSASAQSSGDRESVLTRSAADLTCSDVVGMDDQGTGSILYYVAGYIARGSADMDADAAAADDAGAASEPTHALAPTGSDNAAASQTASESAATETSETGAASGTAGTPDGSPGATLASVGGFEIDVKQAVADCEAAPEARLTELIEQQRALK